MDEVVDLKAQLIFAKTDAEHRIRILEAEKESLVSRLDSANLGLKSSKVLQDSIQKIWH